MKLAEALLERADCNQRLIHLRERIKQNALHQEGEQPSESPHQLIQEYQRTLEKLESLIIRINLSNQNVTLENGLNMIAALAKRDVLKNQHAMLLDLAQAATTTFDRYSRSEIKMCASVDVKSIHRQIDEIAQQLRILNTQIQQANWATDFI